LRNRSEGIYLGTLIANLLGNSLGLLQQLFVSLGCSDLGHRLRNLYQGSCFVPLLLDLLSDSLGSGKLFHRRVCLCYLCQGYFVSQAFPRSRHFPFDELQLSPLAVPDERCGSGKQKRQGSQSKAKTKLSIARPKQLLFDTTVLPPLQKGSLLADEPQLAPG